MQIRVHELHDNVELVIIRVDAEVLQRDDVGVLSKIPHEAHLAQRVLSVGGRRAHRSYLLDGDLSARLPILGRADHAVGACTR